MRLAITFVLFAFFFSSSAVAQAPASAPNILAVGANFPNGRPLTVSDVYTGMPLVEATKIIEPRGGNFRSVQRAPSITKKEYPWLVRWGNQQRRGDYEFDNDINWAWFSEPDLGSELLVVRRSIQFFKENQPSKEDFIAALVEKYGDPTQYLRNESGDTYRIRWNYVDGKIKQLPANDFCVINVWLLPSIQKPFSGINNFVPSDRNKSSNDWLAEFYDIGSRSEACGVVLNVDFCISDDTKRAACINIDMVDLPRISRSAKIRKYNLDLLKARIDQRPYGAAPRL